jgi:hypothetical protein
LAHERTLVSREAAGAALCHSISGVLEPSAGGQEGIDDHGCAGGVHVAEAPSA